MASNTYEKIACEDLEDLCAQAGTSSEDLLQQIDQEVTHWRADERAVRGHLGHARAEVVAILAAVVRKPRGEDFLEGGEGARCKHLGAKGVLLKLGEICLWALLVALSIAASWRIPLPLDSQSGSSRLSRLRRSCVLCHSCRWAVARSRVSSAAGIGRRYLT